jgi:hypothetical protein
MFNLRGRRLMRRLTPAFAFLAGGASSLPCQEAAKPDPRPIAPLAWLVGGTWSADASSLGLKQIETRYQWSDNDAYIRFTTHFITAQATIRNYDGNFFWNPEQSALAMWYMDARNGITQSAVGVEGNAMTMRFRSTNFEGKPADVRVTVTRRTSDEYNWLLQEALSGGEWKQLASLDYRRSP